MAEKKKSTKRPGGGAAKRAISPKRRTQPKRRVSRNPRDPNFEPVTKGQKLPSETLTIDEMRRLLRAFSRAPTGIRNKALLVMLWRAQVRIGEALALTPKDVDPSAGTVRIMHGKGDKARIVGIDDAALVVLDRWLDARAQRGINGRGRKPLFCTLAGRPLQSAYVREMIKRKAKQAGIDKRVHPHALRHTGAAELLNEGMDIGAISKQLGHASIATTAVYLDHINPRRVIETMRRRTWKP